jgi:hypothetical protein
MSKGAARIAQLFLAVASFTIALIIGEFVVARVAPQELSIWDNTRDGITVHRAHADVRLPQFGQRIRINSLGMRDKERSLEKTAGSFRLLVLGDSFMEATQVSLEQSFPALLEREIAGNRSAVEVVNLAVSGWGTDDQVTYLERYGLRMAPDGVLIMMTLHNDVIENASLEFHTMEAAGLRPRPIQLMPWPRYAIQKLKAYLSGASHLYRLAYLVSVRKQIESGAVQLRRHVTALLRRDTSPELEKDWALTLALLDKAKSLAESHGAWLAIGMIPLRVQIDDEAFRDIVAASGLTEEQMDRRAPQRRIASWAHSRGITLIDLLPTFSARASQSDEVLYLPQDGHWSAAGHAIAADQAARVLTSAGLGPQADR